MILDPATILSTCIVVAYMTGLFGHQLTYTSDEGYWMQRTVQFGAALARGDPGMTYRSGHPGVTVMWTGLAGIGPGRLERYLPQRFSSHTALEHDSRYLATLDAARLAMILGTSVLVGIVISLAWRLLGREAGLMGGVLLLLDPYTIGMTRLLHVDALLAPLMAVSTPAGLIWWRDGRRGYLVLSGAACGLALLTKAPAAYLPISFTAAGLMMGCAWRSPGRWLLGIALCGATAALRPPNGH